MYLIDILSKRYKLAVIKYTAFNLLQLRYFDTSLPIKNKFYVGGLHSK